MLKRRHQLLCRNKRNSSIIRGKYLSKWTNDMIKAFLRKNCNVSVLSSAKKIQLTKTLITFHCGTDIRKQMESKGRKSKSTRPIAVKIDNTLFLVIAVILHQDRRQHYVDTGKTLNREEQLDSRRSCSGRC